MNLNRKIAIRFTFQNYLDAKLNLPKTWTNLSISFGLVNKHDWGLLGNWNWNSSWFAHGSSAANGDWLLFTSMLRTSWNNSGYLSIESNPSSSFLIKIRFNQTNQNCTNVALTFFWQALYFIKWRYAGILAKSDIICANSVTQNLNSIKDLFYIVWLTVPTKLSFIRKICMCQLYIFTLRPYLGNIFLCN